MFIIGLFTRCPGTLSLIFRGVFQSEAEIRLSLSYQNLDGFFGVGFLFCFHSTVHSNVYN